MIEVQEFMEDGVVEVCLIDKLSNDDFETVTPKIDQFLTERGSICVLLDLRKFQGWEGVGAAGAHFAFVKNHQMKVERLALLTGEQWQSWLGEALSHFVHPEVKCFHSDELELARNWVRTL